MVEDSNPETGLGVNLLPGTRPRTGPWRLSTFTYPQIERPALEGAPPAGGIAQVGRLGLLVVGGRGGLAALQQRPQPRPGLATGHVRGRAALWGGGVSAVDLWLGGAHVPTSCRCRRAWAWA